MLLQHVPDGCCITSLLHSVWLLYRTLVASVHIDALSMAASIRITVANQYVCGIIPLLHQFV